MPLPTPPHEPERLSALARHDLLDTPPEPEFERIAALAAQIFRVPIVLISFLDEKRLWFKARRGRRLP